MTTTRDHLRTRLDAIAERATAQLRKAAGRNGVRQSIGVVCRLLIAAPLVAVATELLRLLLGGPPDGPRVSYWLIFATLAIPAVALAWCWVSNGPMAEISRDRALRAVDDDLASADRLLTAAEFIEDRGEQNGFHAAAIEDAEAFIKRGDAAVVDLPTAPVAFGWKDAGSILLAAELIALSVWLSGLGGTNTVAPSPPASITEVALAEPGAEDRVEREGLVPNE